MKSKKLTRVVALALCVLLCAGMAMPMMGAAFAMDSGAEQHQEEPGAACACDVKCTEDAPNADCPVCTVDVTACAGCVCDEKCAEDAPNGECPVCAVDAAGCLGAEPEPAPVCVCDVKCATDAPNGECPVCTVDAAGCLGVEPEPAPVCVCDVKCAADAPNGECLVCAEDAAGCLGVEPEPAPVCACDVKCAADAPNTECPVCAADVAGCLGTEPEPAPVCACDVKCAEDAPNSECPVCAVDVAGCLGAEPEPVPVCACDVKCAADAPNSECPVCAVDAAGCLGTEPEPVPVCDCTIQCELGAVKGDCPICKNDLTGCTGQEPEPVPESGIDIKITPPSEWATREADVEIRITDSTGGGFALVQAKVEKNGSWQDMTDELEEKNGRYYGTLEISENCTVYVSVTGWDEKTYEKSRYIECFDRTAPTLRSSIDGRLLRAEASDDLSGVAAIYIDGEKYTGLTNGTLDVPLRELGDDFEQFSIQAVDAAGNKSKIVQLNNPNYEEPEDGEDDKPAQECPEATEKPAATTPTTPTTPTTTTPTTPNVPTTPSTPTYSSGGTSGGTTAKPSTIPTVTQDEKEEDEEPRADAPLTPDGQATVVDNATDEDGKEFFTITTPDENVFFLVIDRQRESENVYFLNAVTENDLLALAVEDEAEPVPEDAVPEPDPVCSCGEQCEPGAVDRDCPVCVLNLKDCTGEAPAVTEEPEEPKEEGGGMGTVIFILIAALAAGGAGYYFKIYKPKHDLDDAEDFDELTGGELEEETVNEDAEPVPQAALPSEPEPDGEPDYPEDYPDDDPYDDPYAGQ